MKSEILLVAALVMLLLVLVAMGGHLSGWIGGAVLRGVCIAAGACAAVAWLAPYVTEGR